MTGFTDTAFRVWVKRYIPRKRNHIPMKIHCLLVRACVEGYIISRATNVKLTFQDWSKMKWFLESVPISWVDTIKGIATRRKVKFNSTLIALSTFPNNFIYNLLKYGIFNAHYSMKRRMQMIYHLKSRNRNNWIHLKL